MIISICVIGFNKNAPEFIKRFKRLSHYTKGDGNIYASRIHTIHVLNKEDPKYEEVTLTYAKTPGERFTILNDGDAKEHREIPFGSSHDWLAETDGHRTVIEFFDADSEEELEQYLEILKGQIKEGEYDIHITSPGLLQYKRELEYACRQVNARIYFYFDEENVVDALMKFFESEWEKQTEAQMAREGEPCGLEDGVDWSKY